MEHTTLGKSGIQVSKVGIGVWQASDDWKAKDADVIKAVEKAHDLGVNFVDTAEGYGMGHSESVLGEALKQMGRENFVIATKVNGAHLRYDELQRAAAASAKRLGVKEIDLYQVHWPDPWEQIPLKYTMKALEKLYLEGKIRAIGVSNFAVRDLEEARSYLSRTDIVSNQLKYNLIQRDIDDEVTPYCRKNNISIIAYSPLAQGALTGKYSEGNPPKGDFRESSPVFAPGNLSQIAKLIEVLSSVAKEHGRLVSQVALNWVASLPGFIPIPGAKNAAQATENIEAVDFQLTRQDIEKIERAAELVKIDYLPT
ncbi:MAG: aldo/keto reductase [Thaumarchaeota archaeon]|nr:aldo/keto reductase [Nitrososphaerota archaeon]